MKFPFPLLVCSYLVSQVQSNALPQPTPCIAENNECSVDADICCAGYICEGQAVSDPTTGSSITKYVCVTLQQQCLEELSSCDTKDANTCCEGLVCHPDYPDPDRPDNTGGTCTLPPPICLNKPCFSILGTSPDCCTRTVCDTSASESAKKPTGLSNGSCQECAMEREGCVHTPCCEGLYCNARKSTLSGSKGACITKIKVGKGCELNGEMDQCEFPWTCVGGKCGF